MEKDCSKAELNKLNGNRKEGINEALKELLDTYKLTTYSAKPKGRSITIYRHIDNVKNKDSLANSLNVANDKSTCDTTTDEITEDVVNIANIADSEHKTLNEFFDANDLFEKAEDVLIDLYEKGLDIPLESTQTSKEIKSLCEYVMPKSNEHFDYKEPIQVFLYNDEIREKAAIMIENGMDETEAFFKAQFINFDDIEAKPIREMNVEIIHLQPREIINNRFSDAI